MVHSLGVLGVACVSIHSLIQFSAARHPVECLLCARHCAERHRHMVKQMRPALGRSLLCGEEEGPTPRPLNIFSVGLLPVVLLWKLPYIKALFL